MRLSRPILPLLLVLAGLRLGSESRAAVDLAEAEFVSVMNQVTVAEKGNVKPADRLTEKTSVLTGQNGFAEVKFTDSSVLRLAPETKFTFLSKERAIQLEHGSLLMNVPGGNGGIVVEADGIKGEVTGTTLMASRDREGNFSFVIMETAGRAKVTSQTGQMADLVSGQIGLVRKSDGTIRVYELNLDAAVQFSPLFTSFPRPMQGLEKVMAVADTQAGEVKNETKFLLSYSDVGLKQEDPDKSPLALLFGKSLDEMVSSKNPFLGEISTAAGQEETRDSASAMGTVLGADSGKGGQISDARQPEGEAIASKSNPPGDGGNLGNTDTAAGGGDLGSTDTAAGGGGAPDTQAPTPPSQGPTTGPTTGSNTGGGTTVPPVNPGIGNTEGEATPFKTNLI